VDCLTFALSFVNIWASYNLRSSTIVRRNRAFCIDPDDFSFNSFLVLQIVLVLVCTRGAGADSGESKGSFLQDSEAGEKDVYLSHSCIHDEILHQRRRAGRKEYSVMPQVYHESREDAERVRGRHLLGMSSWRAPHENARKPIRIYLNYDAVGHSPDRDCKNVGDIVKVSLSH
jgi:leishmanolysin